MSIVAVDVRTNAAEVIADLGDPWTAEGWRTGAYMFSFRPGNVDGVVGVGSGLCDGIGRISEGGVQPLDLQLDEPAGANVADIWSKPCVESVNVVLPTWSADGTTMALFVSPGSRGRDGWSRSDPLYDLLVLDQTTDELRPVATGFRNPMSLEWAPDGTTLAIVTDAGEVDAIEEADLWFVDVVTGARNRVVLDKGFVKEVIWSPDGSRLAGVLTDENLADDPGWACIVLFDRP